MSTANLAQKAYQHLQVQLSNGVLVPGNVVSEKRLAAELGISRTPVGKAISKLVLEGLLEQVPRYGTVVKDINRRDIEDLYELREAMEPYAARKAAERMTKSQLDQLSVLCRSIEKLADTLDSTGTDILDGETLRDFLSADLAFHLFILRASANARMLKVVRESRFVSQVFRVRRAPHNTAMVRTACEYHKQIYNALMAGDGESAAQYMLEHIQRSKQETMAFFDEKQNAIPLSDSSLTLGLSDDVRRELSRLDPTLGSSDVSDN